MKNPVRARVREKGFVLLLMALSAGVLFPMAGLAVDVIMLYMIKARMSAAVDAGALAGARSLNRGISLAAQASAATDTARNFYLANFPHGYMMTPNPNPLPTIGVSEPQPLVREVRIDAQVQAPLFFMRWFNSSSATVRASGIARRRDVNISIVLDRSGSLQTSGACPLLKSAAAAFVDNFSEGRDNVGLVTFGQAAFTDFQASTNFTTASPNVKSIINSISCSGWTNGATGISLGYLDLQRLNQPGALNVILYFTDGISNSLHVESPIKAGSPCNGPGPLNGILVPDAEDVASAPIRGMFRPYATQQPASDPGKLSNSSGQPSRNCSFQGTRWSAQLRRNVDNSDLVMNDLAYIPNTDYYGNTLDTGWSATQTPAPGHTSVASYIPRVNGKITISRSDQLRALALNALDSAAQRIRNDNVLTPFIYTVGLGQQGTGQDNLLRRVANDPNANPWTRTLPTGKYVKASNGSELDAAFKQIASEILRLSM